MLGRNRPHFLLKFNPAVNFTNQCGNRHFSLLKSKNFELNVFPPHRFKIILFIITNHYRIDHWKIGRFKSEYFKSWVKRFKVTVRYPLLNLRNFKKVRDQFQIIKALNYLDFPFNESSHRNLMYYDFPLFFSKHFGGKMIL